MTDEDLKKEIVIENGTALWDINTSEPIGGTYMGTFKFRCSLTPIQVIEANRDYRELLGKDPLNADPDAENLAYSLSQLRQRVISAPPFWNKDGHRFGGAKVDDVNVILLVLKAAIASEFKYREELKERHQSSLIKLKQALEAKYQKADEDTKTNQEFEELDKLSDLPAEEPKKKKKK
jgi:hypothetical protein